MIIKYIDEGVVKTIKGITNIEFGRDFFTRKPMAVLRNVDGSFRTLSESQIIDAMLKVEESNGINDLIPILPQHD